MAKKKLVLLHTNDMHGHFLSEFDESGHEIGGLARMSGYVNTVRREEKNTIFAIAGDMFRGSIIDSEFLGLSTIDLVNLMNPDIATIGNHEVDYGLAHLLFLEKCATFPIINANLFVTINNARLFMPYLNIEVDGMRIMFIGILTEEVLASTKSEKVIGTFVDVKEASKEVGVIADNYRTKKTDMTILVTHIGIEKDRELASLLDPEWGIDLIIGGHSHTFMEKMEIVNGVPIVQAGMGTTQIGRFDIVYDTWRRKIVDLQWSCVPISPETAQEDQLMLDLINHYQSETDAKYKRVLTHFVRPLTHPSRYQETELGNLYADMLQEDSSFDIMMMGSGAIRKEVMGPIVDMQAMLENTPFDDNLWMLKVTGEQFRHMIQFIMRDEAWEGHTEFYQYSKGVKIVYRKSTHTIEELSLNGQEIKPEDELLIAMQTYHYNNFTEFFDVPIEEVKANMKPRIVATSVNNIVEEYFSTHQRLDAHVEGRITLFD